MISSLVNHFASIIRNSCESLPDLKSHHNAYPIIEKEDIFIVNEMHECRGLRKVHLETGYTDNIEVMHCVLYPDPEYPIPIFGADIVATPTVVTAAIADISPVYKTDNIYKKLGKIANRYEFKEKRPLPEWADIFSPYCQFMRLRTEEEKSLYGCMIEEFIDFYVDIVKKAKKDTNWVNTMLRFDDQIHYCKQQRKNKKTKAVLSKWFSPEFAEGYINDILFDVPPIPK